MSTVTENGGLPGKTAISAEEEWAHSQYGTEEQHAAGTVQFFLYTMNSPKLRSLPHKAPYMSVHIAMVS